MGVTRGYKQSAEHVSLRMAARLATLKAKPKQITADWLFVHYTLLRLDCVQIGGLLHRDPKTIWAWMRHYGIPTRPRGDNHDQLCKDGSAFRGRRHTPEARERFRQLRLADGRVPYLKDGKPYWQGKTGAQHVSWKGGVTPDRQQFYCSPEWKAACVVVWHRADAKCERCGIHHNTARKRGTFHVHHIVTFAVRELRAEPSNLALLCGPCHRFVHSRANIAREFLPCQ